MTSSKEKCCICCSDHATERTGYCVFHDCHCHTSTPKTDEGMECPCSLRPRHKLEECAGPAIVESARRLLEASNQRIEFSGATFERHHEHKTDEGKRCCEKCDYRSWVDGEMEVECRNSKCPCHEHKAVEGWEEEFAKEFGNLVLGLETNGPGGPVFVNNKLEVPRLKNFISSLILKSKEETHEVCEVIGYQKGLKDGRNLERERILAALPEIAYVMPQHNASEQYHIGVQNEIVNELRTAIDQSEV